MSRKLLFKALAFMLLASVLLGCGASSAPTGVAKTGRSVFETLTDAAEKDAAVGASGTGAIAETTGASALTGATVSVSASNSASTIQSGADTAEAGRSSTGATSVAGAGTTGEQTVSAAGESTQTAQEMPQEQPSKQQDAALVTAPAEETPAAPASVRGSRILFVGDSRTIDLFADSDAEISGENHDGIIVYARHGHGYSYMTSVVDGYGHDNFDVLVTWMGANDGGNFSAYEGYYNALLQEGKSLIVCTVGPTDDVTLAEWDHPNYENGRMQTFNNALVTWANNNGVKIIDLYTYIAGNVAIDPADGIHYTPRPTTGIWNYIVGAL